MAAILAPPSRSPTICWTSKATRTEIGKTTGKDAAAGKATMVAVLGLELARAHADMLAGRPRRISTDLATRAANLRALAEFVCPAKLSENRRFDEPNHHPVTRPRSLPGRSAQFLARAVRQLADELRAETVDAVSVTGGHLGASLGVVELTVAIHAVFDTPTDRLLWDVGHQAYPHKILTGRRDRIRTLRQGGGLSGFTKRARERIRPVRRRPFLDLDLRRPRHGGRPRPEIGAQQPEAPVDDRNVICVIGDGAMSAGMAYEAMNNAGALRSRLIVILNDNDMSIAPPVGAMSAYLSRLMSSRSFLSLRELAGRMAKRFPAASSAPPAAPRNTPAAS